MTIQVIENQKKKKSSWDETIRTIVYAILIAVVFRSFAFEPFHIPSGSMKSNLLVGDYLFVSKYSYGYSRYSFPLGLPLFKGRIGGSEPKRGDVVVFRPPSQPRIDFIKRIMGLPGDKIQVKQGVLYINGAPLPRHQVDDYTDNENPRNVHPISRFEETLPEGKVVGVLKERDNDYANNTPVFTVPEGHYFMMGDNRD
ncbi:MAG: signal peptidase I, partial [Alphaproteobacteria bacterium]|nr:signal peptidase I [Alphaproteobacteria bacterium]